MLISQLFLCYVPKNTKWQQLDSSKETNLIYNYIEKIQAARKQICTWAIYPLEQVKNKWGQVIMNQFHLQTIVTFVSRKGSSPEQGGTQRQGIWHKLQVTTNYNSKENFDKSSISFLRCKHGKRIVKTSKKEQPMSFLAITTTTGKEGANIRYTSKIIIAEWSI